MATSTKKTEAARKPIVASDYDVMLWKDIEKKYPGYYVTLIDDVPNPKDFFPLKGRLLCKAKNWSTLIKQERRFAPTKGVMLATYYVETEADKNRPRRVCIY